LLAPPLLPRQDASAPKHEHEALFLQQPRRHHAKWTRWLDWALARLDREDDRDLPPIPELPAVEMKPQEDTQTRVRFDGVVYTSVFNPLDGRKNWKDLVTAFCWAFRDTSDATLILKIVQKDQAAYVEELVLTLFRLAPFKCRVLAFHSYLEDDEYENLIGATSYYVNTSNCEGLCLPLMEFMGRGIPVIAPSHTGMADYIDTNVAFVTRSSLEHNVWPQDPGRFFKTMRYRLNWESLLDNFRNSYHFAKATPEQHAAMGFRAQRRIKEYCSIHTVKKQLRLFLDETEGLAVACLDASQPTSML
jgi:glycosyltransferase involved in cell wall biosynthesis